MPIGSSLLKEKHYTDNEQLMQDYNSFRKISQNSKNETLAPPYMNFKKEITEAAHLSMSTTMKIIQLRNIYQAHKNHIDESKKKKGENMAIFNCNELLELKSLYDQIKAQTIQANDNKKFIITLTSLGQKYEETSDSKEKEAIVKEIRDKLEFQSTIINIKLSLSDKVIQSKFSDYVVKQTELEEFLN